MGFRGLDTVHENDVKFMVDGGPGSTKSFFIIRLLYNT